MSRRLLAVLVVVLLAGLAVTTAAGARGDTLRARLSGTNELGKGAGKGTFRARFRNGRLCYTLTISGVRNPLAAHIHKGTARQNGAVVVDLMPRFRNGRTARCVRVGANQARAIRRHASRYYVNVHTKRFPDGAMRGQLHA